LPGVLAVTGVLVLGAPAASNAAVRAGGAQAAPAAQAAAAQAQAAIAAQARASEYYATSLDYVIRFRARITTWWMQRLAETAGTVNVISSLRTGPEGLIGPPVRLIAGPNVDNVYGALPALDLRGGPQILTIPPTSVVFSIAHEDAWGDYFDGVPAKPGTYAMALASWRGTLPPGVTRVNLPYPVSQIYVRADRYTPDGVNQVAEAKALIEGLRLASVSAYEADPNSGPTRIIPQIVFGISGKLVNDRLARVPTAYLRTLQTAMQSPTTQPVSAADRAVSDNFDRVFAAAQQAARRGNPVPLAQMNRAVGDAQRIIARHWFSHTIGGSNWIYFNNIGNFGTDYLARDGSAEYSYGSNPATTATYYFAYEDACGKKFRGPQRYRLTFSKEQIPDAIRFWSFTLYTPAAVGLFQWPGVNPVPPKAKNVAGYTPGLVTNPDGSITIYIQPRPPAQQSLYPNWMPTPTNREFLFWLRIYGPTGNTALDQNYVPPRIEPVGGC
jgi:hypothetical protein